MDSLDPLFEMTRKDCTNPSTIDTVVITSNRHHWILCDYHRLMNEVAIKYHTSDTKPDFWPLIHLQPYSAKTVAILHRSPIKAVRSQFRSDSDFIKALENEKNQLLDEWADKYTSPEGTSRKEFRNVLQGQPCWQ